MEKRLEKFITFQNIKKGFEADIVSTETFLKARNLLLDIFKSMGPLDSYSFGDTEHSSLNVNDLMEALADTSEFKHYCDSIVTNEKGKLLIIQRTMFDDLGPGEWCLPGGKADHGEFLKDAAKRELFEETGLVSQHCNYSTLYRNEDGSFSHFFYCYCSDLNQLYIDASEIQQYAWIDLSEIPNYNFFKEFGDRIREIFNIPFRGKFLTEQELAALAVNKIEKGKAANIGEVFNYDPIEKAFNNNEISTEEFFSKAEQYQIGQVSTTTGLKKVAPGKWVDPKTGKSIKTDDQGTPKSKTVDISDYKDKDLQEFAKNSSESDLQAVIKSSDDPKLREIANKELQRREQEEKPQEEEDGKEVKKEESKSTEKEKLHPQLSKDLDSVLSKLEPWLDDEDFDLVELKSIIDKLKSGKIPEAYQQWKNSDISYQLPSTHELIKKLDTDFETEQKFGLDFATKPGTYEVWRSGEVGDQKNGIFFSMTEGGSKAYSDGGKRETKQYKINIKKPLVVKRAEYALSELTGKSMQDILNQRDKASDVRKWWVELDSKVAKLAKQKGYDAITYTSPAPPATREVIGLDKDSVEEGETTKSKDIKKSQDVIPLSGEQFTSRDNFLSIYNKYFSEQE